MSKTLPNKPLTYVLVKPSGPDCNLDCSYCFYTKKGAYFGSETQHRMSDEVLHQMIRKTLETEQKEMSYGWQGGEPTVMGLDFFAKAIAYQKQYGKQTHIQNSFQTNGILLDDSWYTFFTDHNFLVGLSIDGPSHIHDAHRKDRGGRGTHAKVEQIAQQLLEAKVEVNSLSVVTELSSHHATEIYTYLKELGFTYVQFIPCVEMEHDGKTLAPYSVSPQSYGEFLCELFDQWASDFVNDKPTISVRLFDTFAAIYLGLGPTDCTVKKTCGDYLVVEHNGNVYSCDFFVEDAWYLGSIVDSDPVAMLNSRRQELFGAMKGQLKHVCHACPWLPFCRGGCTKDRLRDPKDKRFFHFCLSYKIFFSYAHERFSALMMRYSHTYRQRR